MHKSMNLLLLLLIVSLVIMGCEEAVPITTDTLSSEFSSLAGKVSFLEEYVTFRRTYNSLDYSVTYYNGGSGMGIGSRSLSDNRHCAVAAHGRDRILTDLRRIVELLDNNP